jgi:hypothetical protein
VLVLVIDSMTVASLFRLRTRQPAAPFRVPLYPVVPVLFIAVYMALLVGTAVAQPALLSLAATVLVGAWVLSGTSELAVGMPRAFRLNAERPVPLRRTPDCDS